VTRPERLDESVIETWLEGHGAWRREEGHLVRDLHTKDYPGAVEIAWSQVALAQRLDHHPILTVGYRELRVELWTHDRDGLTELDLEYASGFDELVTKQFIDTIDG
jgi:4a-hydroxytetrahydrobiopterin dehydratase